MFDLVHLLIISVRQVVGAEPKKRSPDFLWGVVVGVGLVPIPAMWGAPVRVCGACYERLALVL